jgi:hypothetical protein
MKESSSLVASRARSSSDLNAGTAAVSPPNSSAVANVAAVSLHAKAGTGLGLPICKKVRWVRPPVFTIPWWRQLLSVPVPARGFDEGYDWVDGEQRPHVVLV